MWTSRICQRVIAGTRKSTGDPLANAIEGAAYQSRMGIIAPIRLCFGFLAFVTTDFLKSFRFQE